MNTTVCTLLYGVALIWLGPRVLLPLTRTGVCPRLSLAVWLSAVVLSLLAWLATGVGLVLDVLGVRVTDPGRFCVDMVLAVGRAGWPGGAALYAMAAAAAIATVVVAGRLVGSAGNFWTRSREHADAARLLGLPGGPGSAVVLESPTATAYCVAGRPDAIVVTTGALTALSDGELAAVLTHERAHLRGRHPQLLMLCRALAGAMPRLPLFTSTASAVSRLVEMRADDVAAQRHGAQTLLDGLLGLSGSAGNTGNTGTAVGAADTAVLERAARLAAPVGTAALLRQRLALTATLAALMVAPVVIMMICHH